MKLEFQLDDSAYNWVLRRVGMTGNTFSLQRKKAILSLFICWLPLAAITLVQGNFWTGKMNTSFISSFDTQARLLVTVPLLLLSEFLVGSKLAMILGQFIHGGFIKEEDLNEFHEIVNRKQRFLRSGWTDLVIIAICYAQVFIVLYYEGYHTALLSWQTVKTGPVLSLNAAGWWFVLISKPFMVFMIYRWILRIVVWGLLLRKISGLNLNIYTEHPDQSGGLGFLGYSIQYFIPISFAMSTTIAGNIADMILYNGQHVAEFKIVTLAYIVFIVLLFTFPMFFFVGRLRKALEESIFGKNNFVFGLYQALGKKLNKGMEKVNTEDLVSSDYSAIADLNAITDNTLRMKFFPITVKNLVPLIVTTVLPFFAVILLEVPVSELVKKVMSLLV